jgi:hypothetical protein
LHTTIPTNQQDLKSLWKSKRNEESLFPIRNNFKINEFLVFVKVFHFFHLIESLWNEKWQMKCEVWNEWKEDNDYKMLHCSKSISIMRSIKTNKMSPLHHFHFFDFHICHIMLWFWICFIDVHFLNEAREHPLVNNCIVCGKIGMFLVSVVIS